MPRFHHPAFDHRADNAVVNKADLRFVDKEVAEEFAIAQYMTDFIPRSVILGSISSSFLVLENPEHVPHPNEVFYIDSTPGEG